MEHVGWFSKSSYDRYTRLSKMVDNNSVATLFSKVADANPQHISTLYDMSGDNNYFLKRFETDGPKQNKQNYEHILVDILVFLYVHYLFELYL